MSSVQRLTRPMRSRAVNQRSSRAPITPVPPQQRKRTWFRASTRFLRTSSQSPRSPLIQRVGDVRAGRLPKASWSRLAPRSKVGTRMIPAEADCVHQVDPADGRLRVLESANRRRQLPQRAAEALVATLGRKANHPLDGYSFAEDFRHRCAHGLIREVGAHFRRTPRGSPNVSNAPALSRHAGARHRPGQVAATPAKRQWPAVLPTPGSQRIIALRFMDANGWHRHRRGHARPQPIRSASLESRAAKRGQIDTAVVRGRTHDQ